VSAALRARGVAAPEAGYIVSMRTDHDRWDITQSVGATALAVALGRAIETRRDDGLVDDPYAQLFVDAVRAGDGSRTSASADEDARWAPQAEYQGLRSRVFDDALTDAARSGVGQVVLLAAGLDCRALRLDWPAGTTVYEIDQPAVLDFKDRVLDEHGADGGATRVRVRADLRDDWPAALQAAGFDSAAPSAWLAEGLLPYLPAEAQDGLFARVRELAAPGSRLVVEDFPERAQPDDHAGSRRRITEIFDVDVAELVYPRDTAAGPALTAAGWTVTTTEGAEAARRIGRPLPASTEATYGAVRFVSATRT
jgi:methyltransferase (TIGR00027 family)